MGTLLTENCIGGENVIYLKSHNGEGDYVSWSHIKADPTSSDGKNVKIIYDGLLSKSGADQVFMRAGFGTRRGWQSTYDHPLKKSDRGWESPVLHMNDDQLNFCFKDSASNWDNNNGENWTYVIKD
nr:carbohydrate-binding protein [Phosphitispora fastidiosa]